MTEHPDTEGLFDREPAAQEREELESLVQRLRRRPVPRARFRGQLRGRLLDAAEQASRPLRLRFLTAIYAGSGVVLLAIAALGVAGAGPLATG
jgi:hypothetical protein